MTDRKILVPDVNHPIAIEPSQSPIVVRSGARQIAKTIRALSLSEASYPPIQYVPRDDVDMSQLKRSAHTTYCPYKGEANYYSIPALGEAGVNAVWTYEAPFDAVGAIATHLAFYPDRVSVEIGD